MSNWTEKISLLEWKEMRPDEKEALIYTLLGITKRELAQIVTEYEMEHPKHEPPNSIFVSFHTLAKMPVRVKKIILGSGRGQRKLQIIPMDADEGKFVVSLQDPDHWGDLFFR